ncbi:MAG: Holliday junction resolvase RuvX [Kyrpidia sp.]|nr:Holliday junction resolvase RuvX [Kyrpidia sp.]
MSRILGLDVGRVRIGVAISDPSGTLAQGWGVIPGEDEQQALERIESLVKERDIVRVVVGLPRNMDASLGSQGRWTEEFAEKLRHRVPVPVEMWDERLTTAMAERTLVEAGLRRAGRRKVVDQVAATVLLQSYLDAHPR